MAADAPGGAEEFARTRLDALRRFAYLICGSVAEAEDLAQIAVIEVWRRWRTAGQNPDAYARRVIVSRNVSRWRRWRREVPVAGGGAEDGTADDPARGQVSDPALWQALSLLRKQERTVVVLHVLYAYTFDEIAAMSGEPSGTVSSRYTRARRALRVHLADTARDPESTLARLGR
ncbi:MAG TPA: sigma-70 family RNA polymerase sigma factor [Micromonosporaceae bacterium]|nr:sigma-70 family RNA polymerase sigma factor [Micromonosporaceae bacterium]